VLTVKLPVPLLAQLISTVVGLIEIRLLDAAALDERTPPVARVAPATLSTVRRDMLVLVTFFFMIFCVPDFRPGAVFGRSWTNWAALPLAVVTDRHDVFCMVGVKTKNSTPPASVPCPLGPAFIVQHSTQS